MENCRNKVRIAAHCAAPVGYDIAFRDGAPRGDEPDMVQAPTIGDAFREAGRRVGGSGRRACPTWKG